MRSIENSHKVNPISVQYATKLPLAGKRKQIWFADELYQRLIAVDKLYYSICYLIKLIYKEFF